MRRILSGAIAAAVITMGMPALAEGDAKKGEKIYKRCAACHVYNKTQNKVGPHLVGIVGRKAGTVEKYKYSKALLKKAEEENLVWTKENLHLYLTKPKDFIKRGKMAFAGLKKESDRANVIAFLEAEAKE